MLLRLKLLPCNMVHLMVFDAIFCCGNMLGELESDSNVGNIVARILLELICVTPSPLTFNATSPLLQVAATMLS